MFGQTARRCLARPTAPLSRQVITGRQFHGSRRLAAEDEAFDPKKTRPESQQQGAGKEAAEDNMPTDSNVNPANPKASEARDPEEGGRQGSAAEHGQGTGSRTGPSGGGSAPKSGGGKSGGGGAGTS